MKFVAPIALALAATSVDALSLRKVETAVATVSKPAVSKHLANKHAVSKHLQLKKKKELSQFAPQYSLANKWIDLGLWGVSIAAFSLVARSCINQPSSSTCQYLGLFTGAINNGDWPRVITTPVDEIFGSFSMITIFGIAIYVGLGATAIGHFFIEDGGHKPGGSLNSFYNNNMYPMRWFLFFYTWMFVFGNLVDDDYNIPGNQGSLSKP
jgi:hypothetical protein